MRTALPIDTWLTTADAAGGPLATQATRLTAGVDRVIPAGRRSIMVTALVAPTSTSPTLITPSGTAVLPEGAQVSFAGDYPADTLPTVTVNTAPGDDVLVIEVWLA